MNMSQSDLKVKTNVVLPINEFEILRAILNYVCNLDLIQTNEKYRNACVYIKTTIEENSYYL